jgi:hypothetical protein
MIGGTLSITICETRLYIPDMMHGMTGPEIILI